MHALEQQGMTGSIRSVKARRRNRPPMSTKVGRVAYGCLTHIEKSGLLALVSLLTGRPKVFTSLFFRMRSKKALLMDLLSMITMCKSLMNFPNETSLDWQFI